MFRTQNQICFRIEFIYDRKTYVNSKSILLKACAIKSVIELSFQGCFRQ